MRFLDTRIYSVSLEVIRSSDVLGQALPAYLADQVRRAAASITLNFAEGCGKRSTRDRRRFFNHARGSAYEVTAVADVAVTLGLVEPTIAAALRDRCDHVCAMLGRFR
ncbi:MAG: four helix bundle protein [Myxococcota bacterium]